MRKILGLLLAWLCVGGVTAAPEAVDLARRAEELKSLHWGLFVCWSFSTFSGKEWTPGVTNVNFFRATECDTDQWARTAKEAGMGYILFLTKHHDGFCLWDTQTTDRKVTKAPLGRDVLAELRKSCDKYGIKLALYFSEGEFKDNKNYHPGGYTPEMKKAQLKELLTEYGPIEYIWFDHAQTDGGLSHQETVAWCKSFQPGCFVGFNHGDQAGADIRLGEMGKPGPLADHGAAGPHMKNAPSKHYLLAEFTYPILPKHRGGAQWFYSLPEHDQLCLPAEKLYADYLGAVKFGNIFSIDVGPDYNGRLRAIDVATLRKVGAMIRTQAPLPETPAPAKRVGDGSLSLGKQATASSTWGGAYAWNGQYAAARAVDGDETTRWGAAKDARSGWLEVDLGRGMQIGRAVVMEIDYPRTQEFAIEYKAGDAWKELYHGTTIAGTRVYDFPPVTARYVRLNILKASEVPTIEEFQLYPPGAKLPEAVAKAPEDAGAPTDRLQWFHEAKYGLFINWGLYAIPAGEWKGEQVRGIGEWIMHNARIPVKEYEQLAGQFNPVKFNADEWAQLAVDAGMKYLVYDCKHHDGFAMYHSKVSKYNVFDATPWHRDPFKELQAACAKRGLKFCFYYSQATDWHEPNGANNDWDFAPNAQKDFDQYFRDKSLPQVKELLENYGPIGLIWFDVPTLMTPARCQQLVDLVRSIQPATLINSRLGPGGLQDYQSRGDNEIPHAVTPGAWETAATINDTWGFKKDDHHWKTAEDICFKLVDIVSKGGNYLLNVGPDADGMIPQPSQDVLRQVGTWLKVNGEAIYGAGRTPFGAELGVYDPVKKDQKGNPVFNGRHEWRCTTQPGRLYIHFFKWPGMKFELDGVKGRVTKASLLADPERKPLAVAQDGGRVTISLPAKAPDAPVPVLRLDTETPALEPIVIEQTGPDGLTDLVVSNADGREVARYVANLRDHHQPATEKTPAVVQWESWRYGGFLCFNDNQFTGSEDSHNKDPRIFNPSNLDVPGWAATMKKIGMRYAVLTTRHVSGFLLWDSATTTFDVGSSPNQPDVVGQFVRECRRQGIAPGLYYCLWGGKARGQQANARAIILAQLHELASRYGEIPYFWFDMKRWGPEDLSTQELYDLIKNLQPHAMVMFNQHIQDGRRISNFPSDILNGKVMVPPAGGHQPVREIQSKRYYLPFEFEPVSQRLEKGGTITPLGHVGAWFTNGEGRDFAPSRPIPVPVLFDWIKQAYDRGASNVLFSLAPDYTGAFRPQDVQQLEELGRKLREAKLIESVK